MVSVLVQVSRPNEPLLTYLHKQTDRQTHTHTDRHTHTNRQTDRQTHTHTHTETDTHTHTHTHRQTDTHTHTNRQTDRQTDRHTHTHKQTDTHTQTDCEAVFWMMRLCQLTTQWRSSQQWPETTARRRAKRDAQRGGRCVPK
eukprot:SAG11_NODE_7965_length_1076_cov_68.912999_2_plen_141_part_01